MAVGMLILGIILWILAVVYIVLPAGIIDIFPGPIDDWIIGGGLFIGGAIAIGIHVLETLASVFTANREAIIIIFTMGIVILGLAFLTYNKIKRDNQNSPVEKQPERQIIKL